MTNKNGMSKQKIIEHIKEKLKYTEDIIDRFKDMQKSGADVTAVLATFRGRRDVLEEVTQEIYKQEAKGNDTKTMAEGNEGSNGADGVV